LIEVHKKKIGLCKENAVDNKNFVDINIDVSEVVAEESRVKQECQLCDLDKEVLATNQKLLEEQKNTSLAEINTEIESDSKRFKFLQEKLLMDQIEIQLKLEEMAQTKREQDIIIKKNEQREASIKELEKSFQTKMSSIAQQQHKIDTLKLDDMILQKALVMVRILYFI
jgi:hypothetical protein